MDNGLGLRLPLDIESKKTKRGKMELSDYWYGVLVGSFLSFIFFGMACYITTKSTRKIIEFSMYTANAYEILLKAVDDALQCLRDGSPEEARLILIQSKQLLSAFTTKEFSSKLKSGEL